MMYLVAFSLREGRPQDRPEIVRVFDELGAHSNRLEPAWLLESSLSSRQIRDRLAALLGPKDRVFVGEFTRNWASYGMGEGFGEWMRRRITIRAARGVPEPQPGAELARKG